MNNLNCLPVSKATTEPSFAKPDASEMLPDMNRLNGIAKIRKERLTDAELFSTYTPVHQESIVPVHQLLF